ncbi:helix-turn-helix domain-containing protein [Aquimarina gracilis]|uniref:Helix-turn-helix domain-containing protein n=1 Tax=Aquimarina gracilis TaxID=874422 RepID=A0ABU6A071_9FLAO|nr:helix-turn-helix domain-containing protein [Aquimarina gracilis]MEB3347562.1 helix-turn-helix domain-containing protein [Aquimarina gracilis]
MMHYKKLFVCLFLFLLEGGVALAFQDNNESTDKSSYEFLAGEFYKNESDSAKAVIYANAYLDKAKTERDTLKMADGYYFLSFINKDDVAHAYYDSIIAITQHKSSAYYPLHGYYNKAYLYYYAGDFKQALDYLLKTNKEAKKQNNRDFQYKSKKSIGILKSRIGEHQSALKALKESYEFYAQDKERNPFGYLTTLFALSDSYNLNKKLDSASVINKLGYQESIRLNNEDYRHYFVLNEGINQYSKQNYVVAKDSLQKAISFIQNNDDQANLSMAYFYLGKTQSFLGEKVAAIASHKKVDDIFQEIGEIMPNNRESYEILIDHYKKAGDIDNQLQYIERLIKVDSTLHTNYRYLIKNVVQHYDTPQLLSEKETIISSLEKKKKSSFATILILIVISIVLGTLWLLNERKKKMYKKRFDELYFSQTTKKPVVKKKLDPNEIYQIGITEEMVQDILEKLSDFEQSKGFLKQNITTNSLAKEFDTNYKYLSKVVNVYKNKRFGMYIRDLRIEYSVEKLKTDRKFRNYTIQAIAKESGFNTAEVFSRSFHKKNGILPSYFIKQLEKQTAEG